MKINPKRPWRTRECAMQTMHYWTPEKRARKLQRKPLRVGTVLGWAAACISVAFMVGAWL